VGITRGRRFALVFTLCAFMLCAFMLCAFMLALASAGPAYADSAPVGGDIQVAQTLGERELTVVIRRAGPIPGPLRVDVITHTGSPPGQLELRSAVAGTVVSETSVTLGTEPGFYGGTLRVDRAGPWELHVDDGTQVATIPFVLPAKVTTPWEQATYGGFGAAGLFLLIALVLAVRSRRAGLALIPASAMVAAIAVAVTAALLSSSTPAPPAPGSQLDPTIDNVTNPYANTKESTMDFSRPAVNLVAQADNARAGQPIDLRLALTDGSTGRPVDDLLIHDNALFHLVVVSPSGRLWHLHPIRAGPGDYRTRLVPPEPGSYALSAELSRRGGGVQLVRSAIQTSPGTSNDPAPAPPGTGVREVGGNRVEVTANVAASGTPSTIIARFDTADLQSWLGMLGHMIVIGPQENPTGAVTAPVWGHVHSMVPASPGSPDKPDETVATFGPDVPFIYTFPLPGRYRVWIQAERGYSVVTIPAVIDVPAAGGPRR
jgi:hypothetical protein